ncbi:Uncharacterized protein FKW44_000786, partial [Caligus rogercresseyi]
LDRVFKWETFVFLIEDGEGVLMRQDNLKHVDVYNIALKFGFMEHELAGANPRFGFGQACFYTKFPVDVRGRLEDLKKVESYTLTNSQGEKVNIVVRLKGIEKVTIDNKKQFSITMVNSFKRVDEGKAVEWFKQFGE